jgi:hypothetical protein
MRHLGKMSPFRRRAASRCGYGASSEDPMAVSVAVYSAEAPADVADAGLLLSSVNRPSSMLQWSRWCGLCSWGNGVLFATHVE